jgi:hypothetical protein
VATLYDRAFDPATGDYVDDGVGGYVYTSQADSAVRIAVLGRPWWGDDTGTDLDELAHLSIDEAVNRYGPLLERALAPLLNEGLIRTFDARVGVDPKVNTRRTADVTIIDAAGLELDVSGLVPFGRS